MTVSTRNRRRQEFIGKQTFTGGIDATSIGATTPGTLVATTVAVGVETSLTAHAGGTQASALALSASKSGHHITVCATNGDSVILPVLVVGAVHYIFNAGAATCQVYGAGTSTINDVATATGVTLTNGKGATFWAAATGKWYVSGLA